MLHPFFTGRWYMHYTCTHVHTLLFTTLHVEVLNITTQFIVHLTGFSQCFTLPIWSIITHVTFMVSVSSTSSGSLTRTCDTTPAGCSDYDVLVDTSINSSYWSGLRLLNKHHGQNYQKNFGPVKALSLSCNASLRCSLEINTALSFVLCCVDLLTTPLMLTFYIVLVAVL